MSNRGSHSTGWERGNAAVNQSGGWQLALLLVGNVLFAAGLFVHAFLYNFYLRDLKLPLSTMGHQVAAMTIGGLLALLPAGVAIDRLGARTALLGGVALASAGLALTAIWREPALIYAAAGVVGLGGATCRVSWGPAIMRLATPARRSRAFTWNAAILIASGAGWVYLSGKLPGWSAHLAIGGTLSGTQVALLIGAGVTALAAVCYGALSFASPEAGTPDAHPAPVTTKEIWPARVALPRELRWTVVCIAFWMLAAALVLPFFNIFFADRFSLSVSVIGTLFAVVKIATAVLLLGAAEAARRWGPRRMLTVWMTLMAPSLAVLALTGSLPLAVGVYVVQGFVAPATNPLIDQLVLERTTPDRHGVAAGWRNAASEGAGAAGASAGGWLLESGSYAGLFGSAALVALVAALLLGAALRRRDAVPDTIPSAAEPA